MIPTTEEILSQLVSLYSLRNQSEPIEPITMSQLASELMYPPIFIINAMDLGVELDVLSYNKKDDTIKVLRHYIWGMGQEVDNLSAAILRKVQSSNSKKEDLSLGMLQTWCMGVRPSATELALDSLLSENSLQEYDLADPMDKKSVYTFYTTDISKQYGTKQFKRMTHDKKTK